MTPGALSAFRGAKGSSHRLPIRRPATPAAAGLSSLPMPKVRCGTVLIDDLLRRRPVATWPRCTSTNARMHVDQELWSPCVLLTKKESPIFFFLSFLKNSGHFFLTNCNLIYLLTVIFIMLVTIGVISVKRFENQLCGPFFMVRYYGPSHWRSFYSHGPEAQSRYNFAFLFSPSPSLGESHV